jgi:hypothetical protein
MVTKVNLNDVFKGATTGDFYSYAGGLDQGILLPAGLD